MKLNPRESMLTLATVAVALFAGSALVVKPRIEKFRQLRDEQRGILESIELSRRLVDRRERIEKEYLELSRSIPQYPADEKMDIYWASLMDRAAAKNGVKISKRQLGEEKKQGMVYELPIERVEWEGTHAALTKFLFDLQYQGAMLDVRQLLIRPKAGDVLRGRLSLTCIYTRAGTPESADGDEEK